MRNKSSGKILTLMGRSAGAEDGQGLRGSMSIQVLMNAALLQVVQGQHVDFGEVELSIRGLPSDMQFHDDRSVESPWFALVNSKNVGL